MALASRSYSSLPFPLLRYASPRRLGTLYRRPPSAARLQLSAAASSYKAAPGNDGGIIAAALTCAPVDADAAAAAEQLGKKGTRGALPLPGYPHEGPPSQPKEGNRRDMSNPSPPGGPPVEGPGGNGGAHH